MLRLCLLLATLSSLNGCVALAMRMDSGKPFPYKGVRVDWALVKASKGKLLPFILVDAPFSLVVDTLCYPFEYPYSTDVF